MTDPSKRGRQSRRKGAAFERRIASTLRDLGIDATRTLQSRGGGREGADVAVEGLHIECKTGKAPNVWSALAQAQRDSSGTGRLPIVIAHREAPPFESAQEIVAIPFASFVHIIPAGLSVLSAIPRESAWSAARRAESAGAQAAVIGDDARGAVLVMPLADGLQMLAAWVRR